MGRRPIAPGAHGEIRPTQIKDRLWEVRVRWRDDAGGYHRITVDAATKTGCHDLAVERVREALDAWRAENTRIHDLTIDDVAERWFAALERTSRRPSTVAQYRATYRGALSPVLGDVGINALDRATAQHVLLDGLFVRRRGHRADDGAWVPGEYRRDASGQRIPLSGGQARAVLHQLLRFAADRGYRADGVNPLDGTETPERRQPGARALTDEEADRLIAMAERWHRTGHGASDTLWHGLTLLRYAGLRVGELLALEWEGVDLEGDPPTITVRQTLLEPRGGVTGIGPTKGGTIDQIALHPRAASILASRANRARAGGFVFATRSGRPVTQANFRRALRELVRGSDLAWVHPHSFRHTLGTKADRQIHLEAARDLLRHKDEATSKRFYVERNNVRILDPRALFDHEDPAR